MEQAALGCAALLQDYSALQPMDQAGREVVPKSVIAEGDAMLIVRTAATGMAPQVQALAQAQRSACLHLLQLAIQASAGWPVAAGCIFWGEADGDINLMPCVHLLLPLCSHAALVFWGGVLTATNKPPLLGTFPSGALGNASVLPTQHLWCPTRPEVNVQMHSSNLSFWCEALTGCPSSTCPRSVLRGGN